MMKRTVLFFAFLISAVPLAAQRQRPARHPGPPSIYVSWTLQLSRLARDSDHEPDPRLRGPLRVRVEPMVPDSQTIGDNLGKPWYVSGAMAAGDHLITEALFPSCPDAPLFVATDGEPVMPPPLPAGTVCGYWTAGIEIDVPQYVSNGVECFICDDAQPRRWLVRVWEDNPRSQLIEILVLTVPPRPAAQQQPPSTVQPPLSLPPPLPPVTTFGKRRPA